MRYLNIEVVLGLVALAQVAAAALHVQLPPLWYVVVPLSTWAIYTLDRLLDAEDASGVPGTGRHAFHARHRRPLLAGAGVALIIAAVIAIAAFPLRYWIAAVVLGLLTMAHRRLQHSHTNRWAVLKDVNVGITFSLAAWAIPATDASPATLWSASWLPLFGITTVLVMIDVILLSRLDAADDARHQRPSIAVVLGEPRALHLADGLAVACLAGSAWWTFAWSNLALGGCLMAMSIAYLWLARWRGTDVDRLRLYLELVLALPLLVLFP